MESEKLLPPGLSSVTPHVARGIPSQKQQSWGVVISIIVIVGMIIVGAFYSWGKRIAEERALTTPPTSE